jgi:hypothetical protein
MRSSHLLSFMSLIVDPLVKIFELVDFLCRETCVFKGLSPTRMSGEESTPVQGLEPQMK